MEPVFIFVDQLMKLLLKLTAFLARPRKPPWQRSERIGKRLEWDMLRAVGFPPESGPDPASPTRRRTRDTWDNKRVRVASDFEFDDASCFTISITKIKLQRNRNRIIAFQKCWWENAYSENWCWSSWLGWMMTRSPIRRLGSVSETSMMSSPSSSSSKTSSPNISITPETSKWGVNPCVGIPERKGIKENSVSHFCNFWAKLCVYIRICQLFHLEMEKRLWNIFPRLLYCGNHGSRFRLADRKENTVYWGGNLFLSLVEMKFEHHDCFQTRYIAWKSVINQNECMNGNCY